MVDLPVMIIVTYRPEFTAPWLDLRHTTILKLNHLGRNQVVDPFTRPQAAKRCRNQSSTHATQTRASRCLSRRSRQPFRSGDLEEEGEVTSCEDQFGTSQFIDVAKFADCASGPPWRGQRFALTASIIGREFSYELLDAVAGMSQATLLEGLEQLVRSDLLGQRGTPPQSRYIFKHALIRDAAFQSILKTRKRDLHQRIAEVLANRFPEVTEPSLNCWHTTTPRQV